MTLEATIARLGSFGKFQKLQYLLACYAAVCCSWGTISLVYILNVPNHRCRLPSLGAADHWGTNSSLVAAEVPPVPCPGASDGGSCFSSCQLLGNGTSNSSSGSGDASSTYTGCTAGLVYDRAEFIDTFASEFDYVCDVGRELLLTTLMQSQLIGVLVGAFASGILSDRFGRKPTLIGSMLLMGLAGSFTSISSDQYSFFVCRFLVGIGIASSFTTSFVVGMEFIGPSERVHAGFVIEYAFAVGLLAIVGVAYLLRYWRWLSVAVSLLPFLSIGFIWLMEESPRWLISVGRVDEAERIVRKAGRINGVQLPKTLNLAAAKPPAKSVGSSDSSISDGDLAVSASSTKAETSESFVRVFCYRQTALMTFNVFLQWWVIALVYYGLSLNSGNLPGDIYLTSFLNAASEMVGYALPHLLMSRAGRRTTHAASMFLAAGALGSTIFLELFGPGEGGSLDWLMLTLAMLGKVGITSAFGVVFLWTAEMYPTGVRQMAVGSASTAGRVGTLLAPFMADLRKFVTTSFGAALPLLIFGCLALLAGATSLLLPETLGCDLPETLADCRRLAAFGRGASVEPQTNSSSEDPRSETAGSESSEVAASNGTDLRMV